MVDYALILPNNILIFLNQRRREAPNKASLFYMKVERRRKNERAMTGQELREFRQMMGLTGEKFNIALGYKPDTYRHYYAMERDERPVSMRTERIVREMMKCVACENYHSQEEKMK